MIIAANAVWPLLREAVLDGKWTPWYDAAWATCIVDTKQAAISVAAYALIADVPESKLLEELAKV